MYTDQSRSAFLRMFSEVLQRVTVSLKRRHDEVRRRCCRRGGTQEGWFGSTRWGSDAENKHEEFQKRHQSDRVISQSMKVWTWLLTQDVREAQFAPDLDFVEIQLITRTQRTISAVVTDNRWLR